MKRIINWFLFLLAKRLPVWWDRARVRRLKSQLKSCGPNVDLYWPLCILDPDQVAFGDQVGIGAFVHIWGTGGVQIGNRVMIGSHTAITTLTHDHARECMQATLVKKPIVIHDDVWIGAHCVIMPGITIGQGAVVGAGAVVTKDVEPHAIVAGVPARLIKHREITVPAS